MKEVYYNIQQHCVQHIDMVQKWLLHTQEQSVDIPKPSKNDV